MQLNEFVKISLKDGMSVVFETGDRTVEYWCSLISGKEVVLVDDIVVSKGMNFQTKSSHQFDIDNLRHSVEFTFISMIKGKYEICLLKEGVVKQGYRLFYVKPEQEDYISKAVQIGMTLIFASVCMAGVGLISIRSVMLFAASVVLVVSLIVLEYFARRSKWKCEEVDLDQYKG